ncbi:hypothetical protein MNAN1_003843 [Malassezia nana]|uniref:Ribosome biogenesis protein SLX9 n=1 Tax=Malassezia nana TaxID=180528 RepID=A0AAF0EPT8_9BASI|nr:hypothetical protein MNAN1_003843 [Malassezia nana]
MVRRPAAERKTRSSLSAQLARDAKPAISKSALRRRKQRDREQLAGNREGLQDVAAAVSSVEASLETAPARAPERERERQPHILADLQRQTDPFAALRTHVRHTLALGPSAAREVDEAMGDT